MSKLKILILDFGAGNLLSISNALIFLGYEVSIQKNALNPEKFDALVIPGVGSFNESMINIKKQNENLKLFSSFKRIIGICIGMQILFEIGQENEVANGLSLIPGAVKKIHKEGLKKIKIPNTGWLKLKSIDNKYAEYDGKYFYFNHSFMVYPKENSIIKSIANYHDVNVPAIIEHNNIIATQFHPEKSGEIGLKLLKSLIEDEL